MPEFGRTAIADIAAIGGGDGSPAAPWTLQGALVQLCTFEVDTEATLDLLPAMLSRPAPPYARIIVSDYPDSPVGPYAEALLVVSSRFLMMPRQFVAASIVTTDAARQAIAQNWRYEAEVGQVSLTEDGDGFVSRVSGPGGLEFTVTSPAATETGIATIRYDPTVVVQPGDGDPEVLTISDDPPAIEKAWLSRGSAVTYQNVDRTSVWGRLRSTNPITGTIARQDVELPDPSVVEPPKPGSAGGLP